MYSRKIDICIWNIGIQYKHNYCHLPYMYNQKFFSLSNMAVCSIHRMSHRRRIPQLRSALRLPHNRSLTQTTWRIKKFRSHSNNAVKTILSIQNRDNLTVSDQLPSVAWRVENQIPDISAFQTPPKHLNEKGSVARRRVASFYFFAADDGLL